MNIQLITLEGWKIKDGDLTVSAFSAPSALEMFDLNIIDFSSTFLWHCKDNNYASINSENDFISLATSVRNSAGVPILYVLPQNIRFEYSYYQAKSKYLASIALKDMLVELDGILSKIVPEEILPQLIYENSTTVVGAEQYSSAFSFLGGFIPGVYVLTAAQGSQKATTIGSGRFYATTLQVTDDQRRLFNYLRAIHLFKDSTVACPEWVRAYDILDDAEAKALIVHGKAQIAEAEKQITSAEEQLHRNLEYKSVLYESGDQLVTMVFRILQEILGCDLSRFVDEKKEDFRIEFSDITFIGEIKGVSSNIKSEPISQVERHYHAYLDECEQAPPTPVKQLLIINPFRNKPLEERDPVHEIQIALAKRNGCLIVRTETLLKIFERFRKHEMGIAEIKSVFATEVGLLSMDAFDHPTEALESARHVEEPMTGATSDKRC